MLRDLAVCLFLVAATLAVYGQTAQHDFVNLDDDHYLYENPHVQKGLTRESVGWAFTAAWSSNWHPLTWLSHMLDCELFGLNAGYHHLVNVLLHILNSLMLYLVLKGMTGAAWRSAMVATLFALHPLHVESVAWVSERKDVLSTLFFLLTLWAYGRYVARPALARHGLVAAFMALGLMAKSMLVTLPFVLLLLDYWPLGRFRFGRTWQGRQRREPAHEERDAAEESALRLIAEKAPLFALAAASAVATFVTQQRGGSTILTHMVPFGTRVANALVSYVAYLGKTLWPRGLAAFYPYREVLPMMHWVGAGAALLGISVLTLRAGRRWGYLPTGWFWYLGTLVPVIGLVQVGTQSMADRYTYIPLIGVFLIVVWGAADLAAGWRRRQVWLAAFAATVTVCCMVTGWFQVGHWRNGVTLFEQALRVTTENALAHNNLGYALEREGRLDEAAEHYQEALQIDPEYYLAHSNLGNVLVEKGRLDEAIRHYHEALRIHPQFALAHTKLGVALALQGRTDEAVASHREALRLDPEAPNTHSRLGVALMEQGNMDEALAHCRDAVRLNPKSAGLRNNLGFVLARQGRDDEAIACYREALRLDPDYAKAHDNLALLLARKGRLDEAITHLRRSLALDAENPEAHRNLAMVLGQKGVHEEAIAHYREAIRLRPHDPSSYNNLAWIRATHPDAALRNGVEAVELAEKACELWGSKEVDLLDTLAAAYAEAGRFREAVSTAEEAISLAASRGLNEQARELRKILQAYRAGRPYRQPATGGHQGGD